VNDHEQDWNFPFEEPLHEVFPQLHAAQNAWMAQVDSLDAPDRKTHELIRMVVTVGLRNPAGVERHARLHARSATWEEILGSIMLTVPAPGPCPRGSNPARALGTGARPSRLATSMEHHRCQIRFRILPARRETVNLDRRRGRGARPALPGLRLPSTRR
jgi:hypothetical protein